MSHRQSNQCEMNVNLQFVFNLMIDVHVMVILATQIFREKKKTTTKPGLFFFYETLMSMLMLITEKELE